MSKRTFDTEREGQMAFFAQYGLTYDAADRLESADEDDLVIADNNDGVYNGILFEFKLVVSSPAKTLAQAVRYCSRRRLVGKPCPAQILLVSLNEHKAYLYQSSDYKEEIHRVYQGAASRATSLDMRGKPSPQVIEYGDRGGSGSAEMRRLVIKKRGAAERWMPVRIDADSVVCWAERYYAANPKATKGDFMGDDDEKAEAITLKGEIREPKTFRHMIEPYDKPTNDEFARVLDCLNDRLSKKELGAYFTPEPYCRKAAELVMQAIDRVPEGNDYVIVDRCAGTGNLERALIGLVDKNGSDVISHCIVSTYEYWEYKVLQALVGPLVRVVIPPTESDVEYGQGRVLNADAMSKEFVENIEIMRYVNEGWSDESGHHGLDEWPDYEGTNGHCTIILFENPPYQDSSATTFTDVSTGKRARTKRKDSYVAQEFKKIALSGLREQRGASREISNLFIWSGFHYYLRQLTDSYVVFSPVKYFKNIGLVRKQLLGGLAFNREYFHASKSVISCCLWANVDDDDTREWTLEAFDIVDDDAMPELACPEILVREARRGISEWNDRRIFPEDEESDIVCAASGAQVDGWSYKKKHSTFNRNIIAYMAANGFGVGLNNRVLTRCGYKGGVEQSFGFYVREDNFLLKLPMWVSKLYPQSDWYEIDVYNTTSDGGDAYTRDNQFLKSCLLYVCLSNQNKCISFHGSDGRDYQNELCLDDSVLLTPCFDGKGNPAQVSDDDLARLPLAMRDLHAYASKSSTALDDDEKELLAIWASILDLARSCDGSVRSGAGAYDSKWRYGVYQISNELNTSHKVRAGRKTTTIHDYPMLDEQLRLLRDKLKAYYKSHITEKMFDYELLK